MVQINSCPFCGKTSGLYVKSDSTTAYNYVVACYECNAQGPFAYTEEVAISMWNLATAIKMSVQCKVCDNSFAHLRDDGQKKYLECAVCGARTDSYTNRKTAVMAWCDGYVAKDEPCE